MSQSTEKLNNSEKAVWNNSPTWQGIVIKRSTRILLFWRADVNTLWIYSSYLFVHFNHNQGICTPTWDFLVWKPSQKNMLLSGDVWSEGKLHACIKSQAFKVHQVLCLSVNEPHRSSAIKLVLLRVVGVTGRTGTANLLLHRQGGPGLWRTRHFGRREHS